MNINKKNTEKRNKILTVIAIIIWILLAAMLIYLLLGLTGVSKSTLPKENKIHYQADANVAQGDLSVHKLTAVEALNKKVEEGNTAYSMNPYPVFADGKSKGNLLIVNSKDNKYPQMVEIYRQDTKQLVYSGGVDVGCKVETGNLLVDLPQGTYKCAVYFYGVDPATDRRVSEYKANAIITVQS